MNIEKTNQIGKINFSLQAIADLAGMTVSSVYGVVGLVSKKNISRSVVDFLKKEDFADGVSVKKAKSGYEVSLYVVLGNEVAGCFNRDYDGSVNLNLKEYHYVVFISTWFGNLCRTDINIGKDRN